MKTHTSMLIGCTLVITSFCHAQTKLENTNTDETKPLNMLDEQVKMYSSVFDLAGAGDDNPLGNSTNYSEAVSNMDAPEELKDQLRETYELYDSSLDPDRKEELKARINKLLNDAKSKSSIEN